MASVPVHVRPAAPDDPAVPLLYASAAGYYDRFAGSRDDALRILGRLWPRTGHTASYAITVVAEDPEDPEDGLLGVLAGFPVADADALVRRFLRMALPRVRPWHLPRTAAHLLAAGRVSPRPPARSWYVDALAVAPEARRRGVARTLLDAAADEARGAGARILALDTGIENEDAQALYLATGFAERARVAVPDARTARALGGEGFVSYARTL